MEILIAAYSNIAARIEKLADAEGTNLYPSLAVLAHAIADMLEERAPGESESFCNDNHWLLSSYSADGHWTGPVANENGWTA